MRTVINGLLILFAPRRGWASIAADSPSLFKVLLLHTIPFALIPALCWYYGVTVQGWSFSSDVIRLTPESALPMCVLFYLAMVAGVLFLGAMVSWMSDTYGEIGSLSSGVTLISYTASPFFFAGLLGLYPLLWLDVGVGVVIACYCIYLLYLGVPYIMKVSSERGFLYASAVFAVALVAFVGLLTATVLVWDFGPAPEYTY